MIRSRVLKFGGVAIGVGCVAAASLSAKAAWNERDAERQRATHLAASAGTSASAGESREATLRSLRASGAAAAAVVHDVLVIGGGATGCAVALDAGTRGLDTVLLERNDFASATSARSTKLIHGGVRYLELAFKTLDWRQLKLVADALRERKQFVDAAPHLCAPLPIVIPCYSYAMLAYFHAALRVYDLIAGQQTLVPCRMVAPAELLRLLPTLARDRLCGGIVYYDGQTNDARMNLELALTARAAGARLANHVEVRGLLRDDAGRVCGVRAVDTLAPEAGEFEVRARVVVNATGPAGDDLRLMEDAGAVRLLRPSAGTHIVLPQFYSSAHTGLLVPKTADGRVMYMLPWEGQTIVGTTERALTQPYMSIDVRRSDVLAAWAGVRPLCLDPASVRAGGSDGTNTAKLSRDHIIDVGPGGMVSVMGGKWTTWRLMGEETVDCAVRVAGLAGRARPCATHHALTVGARQWHAALDVDLVRSFACIDLPTAKHLAHTYGGNAVHVAALAAAQPALRAKLVDSLPFLEAEVVHSARHEYARTVEDVISRRMPLALLDASAADRAVERVAALLAAELQWSAARRASEVAHARRYLQRCLVPPASTA
jgi:glycerol-3-phosphate dehydrogenase